MFYTFTKNNFFFGNVLNAAAACSKPCVDSLFWQIRDELETV